MRLPQKKKPGDPIMAEDWNLLLEAIAARTPRPGTGLELIASSGGFAYSKPPQVHSDPGQPPFSVIGIEKAGASYQVTMKEGWVIERQPKSDTHPAVKFRMPKVNTTKLDATPRPQIGMAIGDTAWCRVKTNFDGLITEDPTIAVAAADQDGVHYAPEDPDASGVEGDYYIKLFKLENDAGTPRVRVYQQSDIEHWAQLWTGNNVGTGARVFKEHKEEENRFKFRTLVGLAGISVDENGDEIEISAAGANINWEIYQTTFSHDVDGHLVATRASLPEFTVYIRGGLVIGLVDPEDDPEDLQTIASDRNSVPDS
jgi:hypothetical protein